MAPQNVARGAPQSGDRAAAGMPDRTNVHVGRLQPATGSHLPSEETAPPFAVSLDFTATLMGRALPAACLVKLIAKGKSTICVVAFRVVRPAKPTARAKTYSGLP